MKSTIAKAYRLLKSITETAVEDDLIKRKPCRIKDAGKERAAERRIATVDQVDALADNIGPAGVSWSTSARRALPAPKSWPGSAAGTSTSMR
ncbi:hypothetical protein [Streptomyces coeruleorubidus]|uniref:hypothetical protein n=1 Tax=Streptomyces coeruleorubidus TaxID=116188 RepID=UPI0036A6826A